MEKALDALIRAPKEVKKSEFVNYFMKNYKITREEAEETLEIYIERYYENVRLKNMEKNIKQSNEQDIKLKVHERIQNNLPLGEYEKCIHLYNPLEFISVRGPIKQALKELGEPYIDLI